MGIQKKLPEEKGTLRLTFSDLFWTNIIRTTSGVEVLNPVGGWNGSFEPRVVWFTYSRTFGNKNVKAINRRKTGSEEERSRVSGR